MASRRKAPPEPPKPLELAVSREEARTRLQDRIIKGQELRGRPIDNPEGYESFNKDYNKWSSYNAELLKRLFTTDELEREYSFWGVAVMSLSEPSWRQKTHDLQKKIDEKVHRLDSMIERLDLIPESMTFPAAASPMDDPKPASPTKKVFVVHGHDEIAKTNLEIFLREIGLDPIVLHRQADEGQTVIEKFEKHSEVGYAFILLTPDEIAYLASEREKSDEERNKEFRARPNVIFEFGFFVGKLGRKRVCCLYTGKVSLPTDVSGMIYKQYDKKINEVAYDILKDLKAAGYTLS